MVETLFDQLETVPSVPPNEILLGIRVLFAEDSVELIDVFRHVAERLGWQGLYAGNALEMMIVVNSLLGQNLSLDAVVADINFLQGPKVTGITAVREIRKAMPNVPVIFISSYVTSIIREEVRRVGAEIVQKPFDPETLFVRLSQLIYWYRLVLTQDQYIGPERRRNSINRSDNARRATDYILSTPERIAESLRDLKKTEGDK